MAPDEVRSDPVGEASTGGRRDAGGVQGHGVHIVDISGGTDEIVELLGVPVTDPPLRVGGHLGAHPGCCTGGGRRQRALGEHGYSLFPRRRAALSPPGIG